MVKLRVCSWLSSFMTVYGHMGHHGNDISQISC